MMYRVQGDHFILELSPSVSYPRDSRLRIRVSSYGFSADSFIDADDLYLSGFSDCLNELYETLKGSATLEDLDTPHTFITFTATPRGHISIVGRINTREAYEYEQELTFANEIDQTELRDFAKALFADYGAHAE